MTNLLIATWNVNSIRARLPIILAWLKEKKTRYYTFARTES